MAETTVTPNPLGAAAYPSGEDLTGRLIGGCLIGQKIGQGGMGAVYKAFHQALDIEVAVKILLPYPGMGKDGTARFIREARAAAKLRHPNIIGVMNVGEQDGVSFIIMELMTGGSLQAMLNSKGPLECGLALGIVLPVLDALCLAYENRIVHRDIKPDNILFDNRGTPKLADLGLAKQAGADVSLTQSGIAMGSPHYMAPEQASDFSTADHRADIYSLGCVLYHAIAGKPPYGGTTHLEVILKHINEETPDLRKAASNIHPELAAIVRRMMAKKPEDRYQTPMEAAFALRHFSETGGRGLGFAKNKSIFNGRTLVWAGIVAGVVAVTLCIILAARGHGYTQEAKPMEGHHPEAQHSTTTPKIRPEQNPPHQAPSTLPAASSPIRKKVQHDSFHVNRATRNPVMDAAVHGRNDDLLRLLSKGASPNGVENGVTPLHVAVKRGDEQAVRILLEKGANPSATDESGDSPLHSAVRAGNGALALLLLNFGSNPNISGVDNMTPLQMAREAGNGEIARMLREHGGH